MTQITFGPFRLDGADRRLHHGGDVVPLRPKTFAVLDHLAARPGRLVTKEQLLAAVWPDTAVTDTVLKVCIREIRDALGDDPESPRYIETAHRLGYRFVGHVSTTNLPAAVSPLIGRLADIADISRELGRTRLLTLTGPGGSGKSRLAIEVAASLGDRFGDGVWWIDLAPVGDDRFVPQAIAMALGVRDHPSQPLTPLLGRFLAARQTLLVIDNCEHVIGAVAALIEALLPHAPALRVLATSREPLRADGERVRVVPPLPVPGPEVSTKEAAIQYDAVKLFEDRATAALSSFTLDDGTCPPVVEICRRLDGMPLAIELAAARVAGLSVTQIASRLHDCFGLLGTGRRAGLARHQTLRAAIEWSDNLLTDEERRVFRSVSVFVGSFTPEAAEHIAAAGDHVLDVIGRLVDKSLVVPERAVTGEWRYRLLETVRRYAHEKLLGDAAHAAEVFARHAAFYLQLAERMEPQINTAARSSSLARLARDHSDLRAAIERALRDADYAQASRLAGALFWFWFHRGLWREGRTFLQAAIAHEQGSRSRRARVLLGDGVLAWAEGDHAVAAARLEECIAIGGAAEDASTAAHALHFLAMVRLTEGRAGEGRPLAEEAIRKARAAGDAFCLMLALASHGVLLVAAGHLEDARAVLEESVERGRAARDTWAMALPLRNLAIIASRCGEHDRARELLEDSLRGLRDLGEQWFLSRSIETLAEVLSRGDQHPRAASLFGSAERLRDAVGAPVLFFYRADYDEAIVRTRAALGDREFDRRWREGRALTPDQAVAYALGERPGPDEDA